MSTTKIVQKGTQFRSIIADENALWEVTRARGNDVYEAMVVNEPIEINGAMYDSDHAGMVDVFQGDTIRRTLAFADAWEQLTKKGEGFYDSLTVGDIVHYHNSFGQFVRCEVVKSADGTQLKPIALVGTWRSYDLPGRYPNGDVRESCHVKKVRKGELFRPAASNIYENPEFSGSSSKGVDPTKLDPIDLDVPEPTSEEAEKHTKVRFLNAILEAAKERDLDDLDASIERIRDMLNDGVAPWKNY